MTVIYKNRQPYYTCNNYEDIEALLKKICNERGLTTVGFKNYSQVLPFFDEVLNYKKLSVDAFNIKFLQFKTRSNLKNYGVRQKEYFLLRGYSLEESINLVSKWQSNNSNKHTESSNKQKSITWHKNSHKHNQARGREFYRKKGLTEEQVEEKIAARNKKWLESLNKAILNDPTIIKRKGKSFDELVDRHGKEKACDIIKSRLNTCVSRPEKEIRKIYNLSEDWKSSFYLKDATTGKAYIFDYANLQTKELIEFNGDFWHCNPSCYDANYMHPIMKITAKEIWKKDLIKKQVAEQHGFSIRYIWESELKQKIKNRNIHEINHTYV